MLFAALVFGLNYFSNIAARFLLPPLPFIALGMTLGVIQYALGTKHLGGA